MGLISSINTYIHIESNPAVGEDTTGSALEDFGSDEHTPPDTNSPNTGSANVEPKKPTFRLLDLSVELRSMIFEHLFPDLTTYYRVVKGDKRELRSGKSYARAFDRVRPTFHIYDPPDSKRTLGASEVSFMPHENRTVLQANQQIRREVLSLLERKHPPVEQSLLFEFLPHLKRYTSIQLASIKRLGLTIPMLFLEIRLQHRDQDCRCFHEMCKFIGRNMQLEELHLDILCFKLKYPPISPGLFNYAASFEKHYAQYLRHHSKASGFWWCEIVEISGLKKLSIKEIWQRPSDQVYYQDQSEKNYREALVAFLRKRMAKSNDEEHLWLNGVS